MKAVEPQRNTGGRVVMPADPTILERIRGCPFARGGRVLVRFRADGYSLVARRSGVPLARLRLTGEGDEVVLLYPSYRAHEMLTAGGSQGKLVSERRRPGSARSAFQAAQAASTTASWPPASTRWLSQRSRRYSHTRSTGFNSGL